MRRLTAKMVFSGLVTACRLAGCPISRSPSSVNATIDGVVRMPSAFSMTFGVLPSITATQELVVPRSMPMTLPMICPLALAGRPGPYGTRTETFANSRGALRPTPWIQVRRCPRGVLAHIGGRPWAARRKAREFARERFFAASTCGPWRPRAVLVPHAVDCERMTIEPRQRLEPIGHLAGPQACPEAGFCLLVGETDRSLRTTGDQVVRAAGSHDRPGLRRWQPEGGVGGENRGPQAGVVGRGQNRMGRKRQDVGTPFHGVSHY